MSLRAAAASTVTPTTASQAWLNSAARNGQPSMPLLQLPAPLLVTPPQLEFSLQAKLVRLHFVRKSTKHISETLETVCSITLKCCMQIITTTILGFLDCSTESF